MRVGSSVSSESRAFVKNAADPQQVRNAERMERRRDRDRALALRGALETPSGRAALMDILEDCGIFRSIWHPSAQIHYNAGQQDVGHKLQARIIEASEEHYEIMEREARARRRARERETDAAHTPRAEQGDVNNGR